MLRKMVTMPKEDLWLKAWFLLLGTYMLKDEVGMELSCITLVLSVRKEGYVGQLQWDSMRKSPTT